MAAIKPQLERVRRQAEADRERLSRTYGRNFIIMFICLFAAAGVFIVSNMFGGKPPSEDSGADGPRDLATILERALPGVEFAVRFVREDEQTKLRVSAVCRPGVDDYAKLLARVEGIIYYVSELREGVVEISLYEKQAGGTHAFIMIKATTIEEIERRLESRPDTQGGEP